MRVVSALGSIELGVVEAAPTIGIIDYSRRVTDDFGVTTVVQRGFSRTLSVRLGVPFGGVDTLQRSLAALRASPAQWVADDRYSWMSPTGFFKTFALDLSVPPLSYCTLTVEGLAETETLPDDGTDPAIDGEASTLRLLQPAAADDVALVGSSIPEADYPVWSALAVYPLGASVIVPGRHRVYESTIAANTGNDPTVNAGMWLDAGPTNRWAMFDQALGTATSADRTIAVTLNLGAANAIALLDVVAATVRVQAPGYDRILPADAGTIPFLDLPGTGGQAIVTISGPAQVSVGTLLIGQLVGLGVTEASPTAGITDFSRKVVDDFGDVTIVQRAWSKVMSAKALIRTDALDLVANRIASVRARPSLWIGQAGLDSLTIYGFFKDFSIEVGDGVSKLSLSIEGLSTAAPTNSGITWPSITDPTGTKPADNATNSADPNSPFGTGTVGTEIERRLGIEDASAQLLVAQLQAGARETAQRAWLAAHTFIDGLPIGVAIRQEVTQRTDENAQLVETIDQVSIRVDGVESDAQASITAVRDLVVSETDARATALDLVNARVATAEQATEAEVLNRQQAVADEQEARSEALQLVDARLDGVESDTAAEVQRLDTAQADETSARAAAIVDIDARLDGVNGAVEAAVTGYQEAIADEAGARASQIDQVEASIGNVDARVTELRSVTVSPDGSTESKAMMTITSGGKVVGWVATNDGRTGIFDLEFDNYILRRPNGTVLLTNDGDTLILDDVIVNRLRDNTAVVPVRIGATSIVNGSYASTTGFAEPRFDELTVIITMPLPGWIEAIAKFQQGFAGDFPWSATIAVNGEDVTESLVGGGRAQDSVITQAPYFAATPGDYQVTLRWASHTSTTLRERSMFVKGFPATQ